MRLTLVGALFLTLAATTPVGAASEPNDSYIQGYAAAVLQREFQIKPSAVSVEDGVVSVRADLSESEKARLRKILGQVAGVRDVRIEPAETRLKGWIWLPGRALFKPLIADPRWPRFGAAYQRYFDDRELTDVAAVSFGEALPIGRYNPSYGGAWEIGLQAGVFAIFDLDSDSFDLINADYFAAIPVTYSIGNFSALFRIFHQSSHLGDEFLLRNPVKRINLSYEAINLLLSYELKYGFRLYGGSSYLYRVDPSDIRPWRFQGGAEYVGPTFANRFPIRPIAAVDVQVDEEGGWVTNVAPSVGIQFESLRSRGRNLQFFLQYFKGRSPNGQFYDRSVEYMGVGGQFHF